MEVVLGTQADNTADFGGYSDSIPGVASEFTMLCADLA